MLDVFVLVGLDSIGQASEGLTQEVARAHLVGLSGSVDHLDPNLTVVEGDDDLFTLSAGQVVVTRLVADDLDVVDGGLGFHVPWLPMS